MRKILDSFITFISLLDVTTPSLVNFLSFFFHSRSLFFQFPSFFTLSPFVTLSSTPSPFLYITHPPLIFMNILTLFHSFYSLAFFFLVSFLMKSRVRGCPLSTLKLMRIHQQVTPFIYQFIE